MKKHSSMRRTFAVLLIIGLVSAMFMALPVFAGSDGTEESAQTIFSLEDLAGKVVGVQTGTTGDIYISDDPDLKLKGVERYNTGFEAVQALSQNKIDAVVIDDQPAQAFVAQMKRHEGSQSCQGPESHRRPPHRRTIPPSHRAVRVVLWQSRG